MWQGRERGCALDSALLSRSYSSSLCVVHPLVKDNSSQIGRRIRITAKKHVYI
jgi:hypothetical protein